MTNLYYKEISYRVREEKCDMIFILNLFFNIKVFYNQTKFDANAYDLSLIFLTMVCLVSNSSRQLLVRNSRCVTDYLFIGNLLFLIM